MSSVSIATAREKVGSSKNDEYGRMCKEAVKA
jgi:hypothetical protein